MTLTTDCEGDTLRLTVEDEGQGFPESRRSELLGAFVRGESDGTPGSGLGLHVVQQIASQHGGTLRLQDRADGRSGARVELRLPLEATT